MHWICPSCQQHLERIDNRWQCEQKHSFDMAKEGYINLLLAHQKNSKQPGDNKAMVNARRGFLQSGYYSPLAEKLAELLQQHLSNQQIALFDAGCGEGYYLEQCRAKLTAQGKTVAAGGVDISKFAIQKAAKQYADASFAVASTYAIPVADKSIDAVIQVFAPASSAEIKRLLDARGIWLKVDPAPNHLHQLKSFVYEQAQSHKEAAQVPEGFTQLSSEQINFDFDLDDPLQRENLLAMTPFYWSISEENKARLLTELTQVTAHFQISLFQNSVFQVSVNE